MEQKKLCVMLYSKYSQKCNDFIGLLKTPNLGVDLIQILNLNLICIDNEIIRSQIIKSNKVQIVEVPSVLNIYSDGGVEKYEGITAFQWINEIISKYVLQAQQAARIPQAQPQLQPQLQQPQAQPKQQPQIKKQTKSKIIPKETLIDDLVSESEEESEHQEEDQEDEEMIEPQPPLAPIRSNSGNFEFSNKFKDKDKKKKPPVVVENNVSIKKGNLMAAALAMQKLREGEDDGKRPLMPK